VSPSWPLTLNIFALEDEQGKVVLANENDKLVRRSNLQRHPIRISSGGYQFWQTMVRRAFSLFSNEKILHAF